MIGLTLLVIAMIASYSGAFAKPTLHHMTVAVTAPEQVVNSLRGQEALAVNEVGDDAAARRQVYERKSDAAFVVSPTPEAVAAAEPGQAQEDQALDEAGEVQVQDTGPTPPVPTAVETPLTPEPLASASDTEQPAPAADDTAPPEQRRIR